MKKVIATIAISGLMAFCLAGCGSSDESSSSSSSSDSIESIVEAEDSIPVGSGPAVRGLDDAPSGSMSENGDSYDSFFEEYTYRMELETPILIDEYNSQSESLGNNPQARSELRDEKLAALERIYQEGIDKMAEFRIKTHGDMATYDEYANRLNEVYRAQADIINEA